VSLASTKSDAKEGDIGEYMSWSSDGIIVEEDKNVFVSLSVGELEWEVAIRSETGGNVYFMSSASV